MASIVLGNIGASVGRSLGGVFAGAVGQAIGGFAGYMLDQAIFSKNQSINTQDHKIGGIHVQTASYGSMIPILYGKVAVCGNIIWATKLKTTPHTQTERSGGKGYKVTRTHQSFTYSISLAIAICEGKIDAIEKIWASQRLLNFRNYNIRIYKGDEDQLPDPLIEGVEGFGKTPAFRSLAYVVFENLELAEFDNRLPQFTFEVRKSKTQLNIGKKVEDMVTSIVMIPGGGEFVYDTVSQVKVNVDNIEDHPIPKGVGAYLNQHTHVGKTNSVLSLDQLQDTLTKIKWVAPVVTWFATSLNIAEAKIRPGVEFPGGAITLPDEWLVSGYNRSKAHQITKINGSPIYGGSVNDASVVRYLDEIKSRGLNVMFYPMIFVDTKEKPWRGRMYGDISDVDSFFNGNEGYNAFILHYAHLVKGKVDAFLIGSEMVGITKIKTADNRFLAVQEIIKLAKKVKDILGEEVKISYAADWSEYHHTDYGWYSLDDLWSSPHIDFIGIDAYFPLTGDNNERYDLNNVIRGWDSGEGYDFYYEDQARTVKKPLGAPYAWKNIEWWWSNEHFNPDGQRTSWIPKSKKIWFTEYGFSSIDLSSNQPNVFYDPTSKESTLPRMSKGRSDFRAQRIAIQATEERWSDSEIVERKFLWTWDARPYPTWPALKSFWADFRSWEKGHWVQGKLGNITLEEVIRELCYKIGVYNIDTSDITETISGIVIDRQTTVRKIIELLQSAYFFKVSEYDKQIIFTRKKERALIKINEMDFVNGSMYGQKLQGIGVTRQHDLELPNKVNVNFINIGTYLIGNQHANLSSYETEHNLTINLPIVMENSIAHEIAHNALHDIWAQRMSYTFLLPIKYLNLTCNDLVSIEISGMEKILRILTIDIGKNFILKISAVEENRVKFQNKQYCVFDELMVEPISPTRLEILDIPLLPHESLSEKGRILIAACGLCPNWNGAEIYLIHNKLQVHEKEFLDYAIAPSTMGFATQKLGKFNHGMIDRQNSLHINLISGSLKSISEDQLLEETDNLAIIGNEILAFQKVELVDHNEYKISSFLRGMQGTEAFINCHQIGERFVLLDRKLTSINLPNDRINQSLVIEAISSGTAEVATISNLAYQAISLTPLSPVHIKANFNLAGDLLISWYRRARLGGMWRDFVDMPLHEDQELYKISIVDEEKNTIIHAATSSKNSYQYDKRVLEFLGVRNLSEYRIEVAQVSGNVGPGRNGVRKKVY